MKYRKPKIDLIARAKIAEERVTKLRKNITVPESIILGLLEELNLEFVFQKPFFNDMYFLIADFYLPEHKLCIEVDGSSHQGAKKKRQENRRKWWLRKKGIEVLRIRNKAAYKMRITDLAVRIDRAVKKNRK